MIFSYNFHTILIAKLLIISVLAFIFSDCGNTLTSQREEEIERKEAELREKELTLREQAVKLEEEKIKASGQKSMPELYNEVKPGVVLILTQHNEQVSQGSAFIVNKYGLAISNYHVFENASDAIAINENGDRMMITEIYDYSKEDDYIIFRIGSTSSLPYVELADELPPIGEACFTVGNPKGLTQSFSSGYISSYRDNLIQTTTEITYGSSGGPLFNKEGKVIGITSGGMGEANINFAININTIPIRRFLDNNSTLDYITQNISKDVEPRQESATESKTDLERLISSYYDAIETENWDVLSSFYSPVLKRYFDKFNISSDDAIAIAKNYKGDFGISQSTTSVRWATLTTELMPDNHELVEFIIDYTITYDTQKSRSFVLNIIIEFTEDHKIVSIYENIVKSY